MQFKCFTIHKNLSRRAGSHEFISGEFYDLVSKMKSGCRRGFVCYLDGHRITIPERFLVVAMDRHDWNDYSFAEKIQVRKTILFSKCFPSIFKVSYIVSMPHNSQGIGFIETNVDFCFVR